MAEDWDSAAKVDRTEEFRGRIGGTGGPDGNGATDDGGDGKRPAVFPSTEVR